MSELSLLSSSDEEEEHLVRPRRPRLLRDRSNIFDNLSGEDFKTRYRFNKATVQQLLEIIGNDIGPTTLRNKPISALNQVLLTLRFYATGAFQQVIGDTLNVHKSTVFRIVHRVTREIAALRQRYWKMPRGEREINRTIFQYFNISGFPRVIGTIDCTHVKIQSPVGRNAEIYRNRKGFFSLNVQVVCDANMKILHVVARWPGSVHDSTIFNNGSLNVELDSGIYGRNYLLGDSGYPCKRTLLTPLLNSSTPAEELYNRAHIRTRNTVERCFGVLKRRFSCLHQGLKLKLRNIPPVIVECCVLHNIALEFGEEVPPEEFPMDEALFNVHDQPLAAPLNNNTAVRTALINTVFSR